MKVIENKFEVLSTDWIINYVDELYEPYRVYGLVTKFPKYVTESKIFDGQLKTLVENGDKTYAIYNPNKDEVEKIKDFRAFEAIRAKLIALKYLQLEYSNKSLTENEANDIETKIDLIINEIFVTKKIPLETSNSRLLDITQLFRKEEYFKEVKNLLIENNLIRIVDEKMEWLGALEEPSLKSLKLLCSLFVVLEKKNYLIQKPSNTLIAKLLSHHFNMGISDKLYGNTKNAFAIISDFSKDKEYYDFYHFIPKKQ